MSIEESLASINSNLRSFTERLSDHTTQDADNFNDLKDQIGILDDKIDLILLREATRIGEAKGIQRYVIITATFISGLVGSMSALLVAYVS